MEKKGENQPELKENGFEKYIGEKGERTYKSPLRLPMIIGFPVSRSLTQKSAVENSQLTGNCFLSWIIESKFFIKSGTSKTS